MSVILNKPPDQQIFKEKDFNLLFIIEYPKPIMASGRWPWSKKKTVLESPDMVTNFVGAFETMAALRTHVNNNFKQGQIYFHTVGRLFQ